MRTTNLKNFEFASRTHKGLVRKINEDFLAYFDTINGHVFVLCDGMGGHSAGDVASEMAAESIGNYFNKDYYKNPFESVKEAVIIANNDVITYSKSNNYLNGMGTTIVLILIRDDRVFYAHAGDSRLYVYRENKLTQLTLDHSYIQTLLDKGLISKKDALSHPRRHEVTRAVGLSEDFVPDVSPEAFIPKDGDILLLCSDGLTTMLTNEEISLILSSKYKLNDKAQKLIKRSNKKGGLDNVAVQIIRFYNLSNKENEKSNTIKALSKNKKLSYISASILIIVFAFMIGLLGNNKEQIHNKQKKGENSFDKTEIFAYTTNKDETWESIAQKFNSDTSKLKALNPNVKEPNNIIHLKIPIKAYIIVKQADDINKLSIEYNCSIIDIMKANELNNMHLTIGYEIVIPLNPKK